MIAEAAQLATFLKTAGDMTKAMIGLRDERVIQAKIIELNSVIISALSSANSAQVGQSALLQQVNELEKQIASFDIWEVEKSRYSLKEIYTGGFAYVLKESASNGEDSHFLCVYCYERRVKSVLLRDRNDQGRATMRCYACDAQVRLFTSDEPQNTRKAIRPDRLCPFCDGELKLLREVDHPTFGRMGVKTHVLACQNQNCAQTISRDFDPRK